VSKTIFDFHEKSFGELHTERTRRKLQANMIESFVAIALLRWFGDAFALTWRQSAVAYSERP
jgi:hypothetical protein